MAGGALREAAADNDVFDLGGIDAGALYRMPQHVRRHGIPCVWLSAPRVAFAMPVRQWATTAMSFMGSLLLDLERLAFGRLGL